MDKYNNEKTPISRQMAIGRLATLARIKALHPDYLQAISTAISLLQDIKDTPKNNTHQFDIVDEIHGFEAFGTEILKLKNDAEMRQILQEAWSKFHKNQKYREKQLDSKVLSGWNLVGGLCFRDESYVSFPME